MHSSKKIPKTPNAENKFVSADDVAKRYDVTSRYIHQLAAEGRIPSLRLGKKCIRFDLEAVAEALEGTG